MGGRRDLTRALRAPAACVLALLIGGCAAAPPRAERLAALERSVQDQRVRSTAIERELAVLRPEVPAAPATDANAPHYELVVLRARGALVPEQARPLRAELARALAALGAASFEYRGAEGTLRFVPPWEAQEFPGVPVASLFAGAQAAEPRFRGAEIDLRVPLEPGPDHRVTVRHESDGRIAATDLAVQEPSNPIASAEAGALQARYGLGPIEGWSASERAALEQALSLLRPAEVAALRGLPFRRKGRATTLPLPGSSTRHCGQFQFDEEHRAVAIYDCAFEPDAYAFVGPLERPVRPSARVILHEIAHALAAAPLADVLGDLARSRHETEAMVEEFNRLGRQVASAERAQIEKLQAEIQALQTSLIRCHDQLRNVDHLNTPAVREFLRLPGAGSGFTSYGRTHPVEAYAEAFSLCRTDPEAMQRIAPDICAYFEAGRHLDTSGG